MEIEGSGLFADGQCDQERSVFFDLKYLGKLTDMIENEQLNGETEIKSSGSGNVRMDVMISQDNKFAAVQLYSLCLTRILR